MGEEGRGKGSVAGTKMTFFVVTDKKVEERVSN
jgi:hypothetical protein